MAHVIPADSSQEVIEVQPQNGAFFTYPELYELLSCQRVESFELPDGSILVLDEESKLVDQPLRNERATRLAGFGTPAQLVAEMLGNLAQGRWVAWLGEPITDESTEIDCIAGDALVCSREEWERVGSASDASAD
jgi:hypothetical protein